MVARDNRTTAEILAAARATLAVAELGLRDLRGTDPRRRKPGLYDVVVFGRATTNVLQHLRSKESGFDAWYAPYVAEMSADPLLKYFYTLRSEILKDGPPAVAAGMHLHHFTFPQDLAALGPPPPNAKAFFIGDQNGGSGWEVALPDGTTERYYVELPPGMVTTTMHLPGAPSLHLGNRVGGDDVVTLTALYVAYLRKLLDAADSQFAS